MLRKGGSAGAGRGGGNETLETSSIAHNETLACVLIGQQAKRSHSVDPDGALHNAVSNNEVEWRLLRFYLEPRI